MRVRTTIACLACLSATGAVVAVAPSSVGAREVTLAQPRIEGDAVVLKGRAPARARVRIVRSTSRGWERVATDRADRRGRYLVAIPRPARKTWVVRAVSGRSASPQREIPPRSADEPPTEPPPVAPPPDACGARLQKPDGTWWECTFADDFDGTMLDPSKWLPQETAVTGITNGRSCYVNSPSGITVADGTLQLSAQRTPEEFTCHSPRGDFATDRTSATVTTKGRFNQILGRFAFRAKLPTTRTQGAHPALWLYPDGQKYGNWPLSGEIDVAEWYSALPDQVFPSVHYVDGLNDIHTGKRGRFADVSDWHVYELEWTAKKMLFYYDGELIWEHTWAPLAPLIGQQPFDQPFNVILTQAWGGLWNAPTAATPDRVTMTVDWVRVWQ
jgi:beta-glucanase (GH16 family)